MPFYINETKYYWFTINRELTGKILTLYSNQLEYFFLKQIILRQTGSIQIQNQPLLLQEIKNSICYQKRK